MYMYIYSRSICTSTSTVGLHVHAYTCNVKLYMYLLTFRQNDHWGVPMYIKRSSFHNYKYMYVIFYEKTRPLLQILISEKKKHLKAISYMCM